MYIDMRRDRTIQSKKMINKVHREQMAESAPLPKGELSPPLDIGKLHIAIHIQAGLVPLDFQTTIAPHPLSKCNPVHIWNIMYLKRKE